MKKTILWLQIQLKICENDSSGVEEEGSDEPTPATGSFDSRIDKGVYALQPSWLSQGLSPPSGFEGLGEYPVRQIRTPEMARKKKHNDVPLHKSPIIRRTTHNLVLVHLRRSKFSINYN